MKGCHRLIAFGLCLFFPLISHAEYRRLLYRPGAYPTNLRAWEVEFLTEYFHTLDHFNQNRDEIALEDGEHFSELDFDLETRYGFSRNFEGRLGGRVRKVDSTALFYENSVWNAYNNSETGLESFWIGLKYALDPEGDWRFALDARLRQTVYNEEQYSHGTAPKEDIILGDDGTEIKLGGHVTYRGTKYFYVSATGFYVIPPNDLSQELEYQLDATWVWNYWSFGLGVDGIVSFQTDNYEDDWDKKPSMSTGNSYLYNSINRERVGLFANLNYAERRWGVGLKAGYDIAGRWTDQGYRVQLNVIWSSRGMTDRELKVNRFKEYEIEASVVRVSPRGLFVKIDKGLSHDVEKGMRFDLFKTDYFGGNLLLASGYIYDVGADSSIVRLTRTYSNRPVEVGSAARGY